MAVVISGSGIDMGNNPVSNASQIDGVVINENGDNVATTSNLVGFKNYIINGGFDIDQRNNKAGIKIPAGGYAFTADRWLVNNTTNQPVSITVSDFPTNSGGRTGRLRIKFDTAPTTGAVQISQRIENVSILGGKVVTLSHSFACDAMLISNNLTQNFGTSGSPNVLTAFSSINTTGITTSLTRFSSSITVPSIEGKTIGNNSYTQITYNLPIRTTNIQTIAQVQLEEGSVATPFEQRPYGLELSLCQRYFSIGQVTARGAASGPNNYLSVPFYFPVSMRVVPTVTLTNAGGRYNLVSVIIGGEGDSYSRRFEIISEAAGDFRAIGDIWTASAEL